MAKGKLTRQRDADGGLITEWRGPNGEIAKCMHPRWAGKCAACNDPMRITSRDAAFVVKEADVWRLYHLGAACRPAWIEL